MDDIIASLQSQRLQNYLNVGLSALYWYEYCLTLPWQIRCFWRRQFSLVSLMLYLNCYLNCVVCVFTFIGLPGVVKQVSGCKVWFYFGWALNIVNTVNFQALCCIRLWAICHQRWQMTAPVIIVTLVTVSMNVAVYFRHTSFDIEPFFGCSNAIKISNTLDLECMLSLSFMAMILSECWAIAMVLKEIYPLMHATFSGPYVKVLIEDALVGFMAMLSMSILDVCYLKYFQMNNPLPTGFDLINAILVADLLYKLRSVGLSSDMSEATTEQTTRNMHFEEGITRTLGGPTVDEEALAVAKVTGLPLQEADPLVENLSPCDVSSSTTSKASSLLGCGMDAERSGEDKWSLHIMQEEDVADALDQVDWGYRSEDGLPFYNVENHSGLTTFTTDFVPHQ
ncbi:unnamed protein product [Somion occarium]|uniref:Uncharacterized protein n=1 Tax=Somion occarium TaxID=3059160 RepID=A0ABP1DEH2_9APHY